MTDRADLSAEFRERGRRLAAAAPPLTDAQRDVIRAILAGCAPLQEWQQAERAAPDVA